MMPSVNERQDARRSKLVLALGLSVLAAAIIIAFALLGKDALLIDLVKIGAGVTLGWGAKSASDGKKEAAPLAQDPH